MNSKDILVEMYFIVGYFMRFSIYDELFMRIFVDRFCFTVHCLVSACCMLVLAYAIL